MKNQKWLGRKGLIIVIDWRWQLDQRRLPPSLLLLTRTVQDCMQQRAGPPISAAMKGLIIHNRKYYNLNINCTLLSPTQSEHISGMHQQLSVCI